MGLLSSITGAFGGILDTASKYVGKGSNAAASVAKRIDAVVPHPANGGLENVVRVLAAPFSGGRVVANVGNPTLKKGLELVSNNPFTTAAIATGAVAAGRAIAPIVAKASTKVGSKFASKATGTPTGMISNGGGGMLSPSASAPQITSTGSPQAANGGIITPGASSSPRSSPRRRTKRKTTSKRRSTKRKKSRRPTRRSSSKKKRYGSAKQYARPGGKKVFYAKKTGQPYIKMANGQTRFIKGKRRK